MRQKYREYSWLLHWFQSQAPERRLTVKAPAHCGYLQELTQAVPGLLLIQTHRDPVACVSSACSLIYTFHRAVANEIDLRRMTDLILVEPDDILIGSGVVAVDPGGLDDVRGQAHLVAPVGQWLEAGLQRR